MLDFQAQLGSGSEESGISELGSARARTYIRFQAGLKLGLIKIPGLIRSEGMNLMFVVKDE